MNKNSVSQIASRAIKNNLITGLIGLGFCLFFERRYAIGFGVGFLVGIANLFMLYSTVIKGVMLGAEKAKRHMLLSYPPRFIITAFFMGYMVWSVSVSPITLLVGFTITLMTTVTTIIYMSRGDVDPFDLPLGEI